MSLTFGWKLDQIGLNESYRIHHVSTNYKRSFICIESKSKKFPTLIESHWPEFSNATRSYIFPHRQFHRNGDCKRIQQAKWTGMDSLDRLWVLDVGNKDSECVPKLLLFDLIRNNIELLRIENAEYMPTANHLITIQLGPRPTSCQAEKFIYFLFQDEPDLIVFDIFLHKWQRIALLGRRFNELAYSVNIAPKGIAFTSATDMLITNEDGLLYRTSNAVLKNAKKGIQMELLGNLLRCPTGMVVDRQGIVYYMVSKYGALVRFKPKMNLTTQDNEVIFLTSSNIQQILFGRRGTIWLLTDRLLSPYEHYHPQFF